MPDEQTDFKDAIRENATGPAEVTIDGQTVKQHSLKDQIEADRHLTTGQAADHPRRGIRFSKLVSPGAT